jgi:hypothetical protein
MALLVSHKAIVEAGDHDTGLRNRKRGQEMNLKKRFQGLEAKVSQGWPPFIASSSAYAWDAAVHFPASRGIEADD